MIRFADEGMRGQLRELWSACFGDSNAYVDLYFEQHDAARHTVQMLRRTRFFPYGHSCHD